MCVYLHIWKLGYIRPFYFKFWMVHVKKYQGLYEKNVLFLFVLNFFLMGDLFPVSSAIFFCVASLWPHSLPLKLSKYWGILNFLPSRFRVCPPSWENNFYLMCMWGLITWSLSLCSFSLRWQHWLLTCDFFRTKVQLKVHGQESLDWIMYPIIRRTTSVHFLRFFASLPFFCVFWITLCHWAYNPVYILQSLIILKSIR